MNALAIVDDRAPQRQTVRRRVEPFVGPHLKVIDSPPLDEVSDYPAWIVEHDVIALVVDERLSEQCRVAYSGHDVAVALRRSNLDLPIMVLTAYQPVAELKAKAATVEAVVQRREFNQDPQLYIDRIVRAGKRYSRERTRALVELGELARKIALGTAARTEQERARALQLELHLSVELTTVATRADWVSEVEAKLQEISLLRQQLETRLKRKPK